MGPHTLVVLETVANFTVNIFVRLVVGFSMTAFFISMWTSNTATTIAVIAVTEALFSLDLIAIRDEMAQLNVEGTENSMTHEDNVTLPMENEVEANKMSISFDRSSSYAGQVYLYVLLVTTKL